MDREISGKATPSMESELEDDRAAQSLHLWSLSVAASRTGYQTEHKLKENNALDYSGNITGDGLHWFAGECQPDAMDL